MGYRQVIAEPVVCERTTCQLVFTFTDEAGATIVAGVSTCVLTLYDKLTGQILNGRSGQSVNGVNGGTITSGVLTLVLSEADNTMYSQVRRQEEHVALIEYSWAGGTRYGKKEVVFSVANQAKVT